MDNKLRLKSVSGKLKEILEYKIGELELLKQDTPLPKILHELESRRDKIRDFVGSLQRAKNIALIAEVKKASPSAGDINCEVDVVKQAVKYEQAGADAISVLTDKRFFKGKLEYLRAIKEKVKIPILRKDFIFDPYQVYESKLCGADAILLIAAVFSAEEINEFVNLSDTLGLGCLVETHTTEDMHKALKTSAKVIGINARNLQSLVVDLDSVVELAKIVPKDKILIAESGIVSQTDVIKAQQAGAKGILVGTSLMKAASVTAKIKELKLYDRD